MKTWTKDEIRDLYNKPLMELMYEAASVHREFHNPLEVQVSTLVSIKTGNCSEDCGYCPQAARYSTGIETNDLMPLSEVIAKGEHAKASGSSRVCMGASWRNVKEDDDFDQVLEMVRSLNEMDLEVCCTLGMLTEDQAKRLADAGLYAYNHNLDTSEEYYKEVISTRGYGDRLDTIDNASKAGLTVCSGGILGMGEKDEDRIGMLYTLNLMNPRPASIPINALVAVEGTPLEDQNEVTIWEMIRMIATTRIVVPACYVRLSAGRTQMNDEGQAMCFMSGANSIFAGDKLLTTPNPEFSGDMELFDKLGIKPMPAYKNGPKPQINEKYKIRTENAKNPKWTRPEHKIERNEEAKAKGLAAKKAGFEPRKVTSVEKV
ncbi:MAG: biotin synthase [Parvicella sp.]|jgi:biotin synthase